MAVTGAVLIDNASDATIKAKNDVAFGDTLDVLRKSTLSVTTINDGPGGMAVTGNTLIDDSTATITVTGDATVGDSAHKSTLTVDHDAALTLTSNDGGMAVTGAVLIDNASDATIRLYDDATIGGTLDVLNRSRFDLKTINDGPGGLTVEKDVRVANASTGTIDVAGSATFNEDVEVDVSRLNIRTGADTVANGLVDVHGKRAANGTATATSALDVDAGRAVRFVDRLNAHGGLTVTDSVANVLARTGDMTVDHLKADSAIATLTANTERYIGKTVDLNKASVAIETYGDVRIVSDENDETDFGGEFDDYNPNIILIDSFDQDTVAVKDPFTTAVTTANRGLTIHSTAGAMDSTGGGYNVLYDAATGETLYEKDGGYYRFVFGTGEHYGDDRFERVADDQIPDLAAYQNIGNYNLFVYDIKTDEKYYREGQRVYLEKENGFYYLNDKGEIVFYGDLADKVKDDLEAANDIANTKLYALRDVGVTNYYDGWLLDRSSMAVDVWGDVDIQDTVRLFESVLDITSRDGALTVADYFRDNDGDGIGDEMVMSEWDLRGSVANTDINKNIRIDHLALQVSVMDMNVARDAITSKTWYMVGSRLNATAETAVQVVNADDKYFTPAVEVFWSNDDLYLNRADSGETPIYQQLGLYVKARNGMVVFMTRDHESDDANTTDFYSTASTVDIDARDQVVLLETMVNVDNASNNGISTFTIPRGYDLEGCDSDTINHKEIYKLVDGVYTPMTSEYFDQRERAYGSEINIKSSGVVDEAHADPATEQKPDSHVSAANWIVEGATLKDGTLNAGLGQSDVNITALGDISFLYNLNYLPESERIADRELTIIEGSHVTLASTEGAVDLLYDYDSADDKVSTLAYTAGDYVGDNGADLASMQNDVRIAGDADSAQRSTLEILSHDDLKVASVNADLADVTLRSTDSDLRFDRIDARQTNLRAMAEGDIEALHEQHSMLIRYDDKDNRDDFNRDQPANASLTLSAEGDIGTKEHPLYADIPEALTMTVEKVTNLYVDARKRDASGEIIENTPSYAVNGGAAADGTQKTGDYLNYSSEQFFNVSIDALDNAELAAWLLERSKAVFKDGEMPGWTNMIAPGIDLTAYIREMAGETAPAEATLEELIDLVGEEEILNKLLEEDAIFYHYIDANGYAVQGSLQDLINYLINNDASYSDELEQTLLKAAVVASAEYARDIEKQLAAAKTDKANADAAEKAGIRQRTAAEQAIWSLHGQQAYENEVLKQLQAEQKTLEDSGASNREIAAAKKAVEAQQEKVDALTEQIAQQQANIAAANQAIAQAKANATAAQARIARLQPEAARINDAYAEYTDLGGAETPAASWQTNTEAIEATVGEAIDQAKAASGNDAETAFETALARLNKALSTLDSADAYSEASLARAIELSTELKGLANELETSGNNYLTTANALFQAAEAEYMTKLDAQAAKQLAYENAQAAAEAAQTQADADKQALDKELARSKPREDRVAALQAAYDASASRLTAARSAEAAAKQQLDDATAQANAARAVAQERQNGIARTEAVIAKAKDAGLYANRLGYELSNTYVDVDARRFNLAIGQMNDGGTVDLYNEGDITATVDSSLQTPDYVTLTDSDLTVDRVESRRGDVTIVNRSGSIYAGENGGEEVVHGSAITLEARDSIGAEDKSFTVEETSHTPTRVATPTLIDADRKSAFDNIVGIETAQRFEDIMLPTGSLYTDPTTTVPVVLVGSDGKRVSANMTVKDLREIYALNGDLQITFGVMEAGEQVGSAATVELRLDWVRVFDETEGTELNAIAHNGDIYLTEKTGDVGAGEIRAAGDVVLNVPTGAVAEKDDRTRVQVGGEMTVNGQGDVNLIAEGDLTLNLNTQTNHVEITTDDKTGAGDITVVSQSEKPLTGSALSNGSVTLVNGGDIGTESQAMLVDTDAANGGTAHIEGDDVNVTQQNGSMIVDEIDADGDLNLNVGGDIIDSGNTGMGDALDRVTEAQQALTEAERNWNEADKEVYILTSDDQINRAVQNLVDATDALENARTEAARTAGEAEAANAALAKAQENYAAAVAVSGASSEAAIKALSELRKAEAEASAAQAAATQAQRDLEAAQAALTEAENDPYIVLINDLEAIENAKKAGASDEEVDRMLDDAVAKYRANSPKNGDRTDQVLLSNLLAAQAESDLKLAQNAVAQAEAALRTAKESGNARAITAAEQALADAKANAAEKQSAVDAAHAAQVKAEEDLQAAQAALQAATDKRDHAAEALQIAEDALAAQSAANEARNALEAAQEAGNDKAAERAAAQVDANTYLQNAEENLYDTYKAYAKLAEDGNADPEALAAAEEAVEVARKAVDEARDLVSLANGSDADRAIVEELLDRMDKAVEAEQILAENPNDANAQQNADKAHEALAAAKQAVEAAADRQAAESEVNAAQSALNSAKAEQAAAEQNLAAAAQAYEEALANAQALAESHAGRARQNEANEAAQQALAAKEEAEAAKAAADAAVADATQALADAQQALADAQAAESDARQLAEAAAEAADAKAELDDAAQALADAQAAQNEVTDLVDRLTEADEALLAAQKAYDEAYQDYLNSNTDIVAAKEGAKDTDDRRAALDMAADALENAKNAVAEIVDEIEAITGNTDLAQAEEAIRKAQEDADRADQALADAEALLDSQNAALEDAKQAVIDAQAALDEAQNSGTALPDDLVALETALEQAQANQERAQAAADKAKTEAEQAAADKAQADAAMDQAKANLNDAKQAASDANAKALADAVAQAEANLNKAQTANSNAADNLNQKKDAYGDIRQDATGTGAATKPSIKGGRAAIRAGGNAKVNAGGSVTGKNGSAMTMDTDGKLTVTAGGDVNLKSGKDVKVDKITSNGDVSVTANGNITGVGGKPTITGKKVTLNAISTGGKTSAITAAGGKPMVVNANEIGLRADNVDIETTGDIKLDDVVADTAKIKANGNVTQKPGTQLDVSKLDLQASGDIGSREAPIVMNVDEITAIGSNVYIKNKSRNLLVHMIKGYEVWIDTDGNINTTRDGMIIAHDLIIRALGDIGAKDQPIRLRVNGKLLLETYLGRIWYKNFFRRAKGGNWRLLVDPETQISVYGMFDEGAWLEVTNTSHYAQLIYPELTAGVLECDCEKLTDYSQDCTGDVQEALKILSENSDSEACKQIWSMIGDEATMYDFVLGIFASNKPVCTSLMYFTIDFSGLDDTYDGALEGQTVYVTACIEGELVAVQTTVEEGKIRLTLDRLGMEKADFGYTQFAIIDEATYLARTTDGSLQPDKLIDADGKPVEEMPEEAVAL